MKDPHFLSAGEIELLLSLPGKVVDQLVWDLDALYLTSDEQAIKVEAQEIVVDFSSQHPSELASIRVSLIDNPGFKPEGEPSLAYRVVASQALIDRLWLVRSNVALPSETLLPASANAPPGSKAVVVHSGIILGLGGQCLPALQLNNWFGFHHLEPGLYDLRTTHAMLRGLYALEELRSAG